jgi:T4 beta protein
MAIKLSFDYRHYVPILRQKAAEMQALRFLLPEDKRRITPLIELPPSLLGMKERRKLTNASFFEEIAKEIAGAWEYAPLFVDAGLLCEAFGSPSGQHPVWSFSEGARRLRIAVIPVTGLRRSRTYQAAIHRAVASDNNGLCVRLSADDVRNATLEAELSRLLAAFNLTPKQVDIVVDLKLIGENSNRISFSRLCGCLPLLSSWRTFTVASGSFPKNLSEYKKNCQYERLRYDWLYWFGEVKNGPRLPRSPSFGDYAIQHPFYSEANPKSNVSASIRYTADDHWVIMRGEGLRNDGGPGHAQYWANANLLSGRPEFQGQGFSKGDEYIYRIGQQTEKTGNPTTWLLAGINHHLTFVVRQIASSFGSSTGGVPGAGSGLDRRHQRASRKSPHDASIARLQPFQVPLID